MACAALENGPFSADAFATVAREAVLFCHLETRLPDAPYEDLLRRTAGPEASAPHVAYLDPAGDVIAHHKGRFTVESMAATLKRAERFLALRSADDPVERLDLLLVELGVLRLTPEEAAARADALDDLPADEARRLEGALADHAIMSLWHQTLPRSARARAELGARYWAMYEEDRRPSGAEATQTFYLLILDHAEAAGAPDVFRAALGELRAVFGSRAAPFFEQQERRLRRLEQGS